VAIVERQQQQDDRQVDLTDGRTPHGIDRYLPHPQTADATAAGWLRKLAAARAEARRRRRDVIGNHAPDPT